MSSPGLTAAPGTADVEGRVRVNYGVQGDSDTSFAGATNRDISYVNRLLQTVFRVRHPQAELVFDGYVRQHDGHRADTSGHSTIVNQLFATLSSSDGYKLKVGRQRALWGHGFAFVPTDFINPPLDPAGLDLANAKGVDSVTLDVYRGQTTLTILGNFDESADREGFGLKLTDNSLQNIDWNLVYYRAPQTGHAAGVTFSTDPAAWFVSNSDASFSLFASVALRERSPYFRPIDEASGELRLPQARREDQPFLSYLIGLSHEAPQWALSSRIEYYGIQDAYDRRGLSAIFTGLRTDLPTFYPWIEHLAYGRSQRHYINVAVGQSSLTQNSDSRFTNTFAYGIGALHGLEDHSTLFSLNMTSGYFDRAEIELNTLVPTGRADSEFGTTSFKWRVDLSISLIF